jgi:hypothetical protein
MNQNARILSYQNTLMIDVKVPSLSAVPTTEAGCLTTIWTGECEKCAITTFSVAVLRK